MKDPFATKRKGPFFRPAYDPYKNYDPKIEQDKIMAHKKKRTKQTIRKFCKWSLVFLYLWASAFGLILTIIQVSDCLSKIFL